MRPKSVWRLHRAIVVVIGSAMILVTCTSAILLAPIVRDYIEERRCIDRLRNGSSTEQEAAAERLGELRSLRAVPALLDVIERTDTMTWTLKALVKIGEGGVSPLVEALSSPNERMRCGAALALGDMRATTGINALARVLAQDPQTRVRVCAAVALRNMGPAAIPVLPTIMDALSDASHHVRSCAALMLFQLGKDARLSIPSLIRALEDTESAVRLHAAMAIVNVADRAEVPWQRVRTILKDDSGSLANSSEGIRQDYAATKRAAGLED